MQSLRNCSGNGSPAKLFLNNNFYSRCPRAIYLESNDARYLVSTYFDCKNMNTYPYPGGPSRQTAFTIELFNYLDSITADHQRRTQEEQQAKSSSKTQTKPKR